MAIRNQPQSEKHPYASPTTPGLYVAFRDLIIELVCLNINSRIGPRFWSDKKYWSPKYRREIKGVSSLGKELDLTDILTQTALTEIIKEYRIKALVAHKTITRVIRLTRNRRANLVNKRMELAAKPQHEAIDTKKNSTFTDTGNKTILAKIRDMESHGH
jgi:hypothetical protein